MSAADDQLRMASNEAHCERSYLESEIARLHREIATLVERKERQERIIERIRLVRNELQ